MNQMTLLKLALAGVGIVIFFFAHSLGNDRLRWVAIGFIIAAFMLRFLRRRGGGEERRL